MVIITKTGTYRFKVVLYGPSLSGKTVMLNRLQELYPSRRTRIYSVEEPSGRTLFFDYMVVSAGDNNRFVFDIYTVPGQRRHARQRRVILNQVDCVIFVADSDPQAVRENAISFKELKRYLGGILRKIPLIIAVNKRDLPDALPVRLIVRALGLDKIVPIFPTIAIEGIGIKELFKESFKLTMLARFFPAIYKREINRTLSLYEKYVPEELLKRPLIKI